MQPFPLISRQILWTLAVPVPALVLGAMLAALMPWNYDVQWNVDIRSNDKTQLSVSAAGDNGLLTVNWHHAAIGEPSEYDPLGYGYDGSNIAIDPQTRKLLLSGVAIQPLLTAQALEGRLHCPQGMSYADYQMLTADAAAVLIAVLDGTVPTNDIVSAGRSVRLHKKWVYAPGPLLFIVGGLFGIVVWVIGMRKIKRDFDNDETSFHERQESIHKRLQVWINGGKV